MTQQVYRRWCRLALIMLTLIAAYCVFTVSRSGLQIDTNLRSLSPSFTLDPAINQALNKMSANAAQQFILVLVHEDEDQLAEASESMRELIEEPSSPIAYVDQTALLETYVAQLQQHSFHMLGNNAQALLAEGDAEKILALGAANLYGSGGTLRLVPIAQDHLGFVNEYAVGLLDRLALNSGDEIQPIKQGDKEFFIAPQMLQIRSDALEMDQQDQALARIQTITAELRAEFPELKIISSGILFFAADAAQSARADIETISTGSMIGVLLLILWIFRSPRAFLLPALSIGMGLAFAFCLCHFRFGSIHILTLVFGASLIGVVVDYALHFYYFQAHHNYNHDQLPLYRALFLSLLTSVIGFSALAWSGLAALQQVATFAALGLVYAWLMVIAFGQLLAKKVRVYDSVLQNNLHSLLRHAAKVPVKAIVVIGFLMLGAGVYLTGFSLPVSDSPRSFFAANPQLVEQEKQVSDWVDGYEPASFIVVQGETAQQVYDRIAAVNARVDKDGDSLLAGRSLLGVQQFFPSPQQQQKNYQANQVLYAGAQVAQQFINQQQLTEISADDLARAYAQQKDAWLNPAQFFAQANLGLPPLWLESENTFTAFLLIPKGVDTLQLNQRLEDLEGAFFFSAMQDSETSMKLLRQSAMELLVLALLLMALLLLTRYHWKKMLQLMAIPVFAVSMSFLLLALFNLPLSLFHVMALFLVVGLGMDYVIFIAEMRENPVETLSAVAISSMTNLLSFGLLGLSVLPAVSAFGIALFIGCSLNLLGALMLASRNSFFLSQAVKP